MQVSGDKKIIANGELADAEGEIRHAGLDPDEFAIEVKRGDFHAIRGRIVIRYSVRVTNLANNRVKTFNGGHGEAWVASLAAALKGGEFL